MRLNGIEFDADAIAAACREAGVIRLWIFGSVLSDRFGPESDIDVLVETDPLRPSGLLALGGLQMDLCDILGRRIHLTTLRGLPPDIRPRILAGARQQYAA